MDNQKKETKKKHNYIYISEIYAVIKWVRKSETFIKRTGKQCALRRKIDLLFLL